MLLQVVIVTFSLLLLDGLWLGYVAKKMYIDAIGHLMPISNGSIQAYWPAAVVVYIALISGILIFVLPKANGELGSALLWGVFFGFVTYGIYDFTNLAILSDWSLKMSIIDTIWGMALCGLTSFITVLITSKIS